MNESCVKRACGRACAQTGGHASLPVLEVQWILLLNTFLQLWPYVTAVWGALAFPLGLLYGYTSSFLWNSPFLILRNYYQGFNMNQWCLRSCFLRSQYYNLGGRSGKMTCQIISVMEEPSQFCVKNLLLTSAKSCDPSCGWRHMLQG